MAVFSSLAGVSGGGSCGGALVRGSREGISSPCSLGATRVIRVKGVTPRGRSVRMAAAIASPTRQSLDSGSLYSMYRDPSATAAAAAAASLAVFDYKKMVEEEEEAEKRREEEAVTAEQIDHWIKQSIGEIVRNIGEAPFLVQIFSQGASELRLEREEALPEAWPVVKKRWDQSRTVPDGVILVEELKDIEEEEAYDNYSGFQSQGGCSQTWGLVVQGRGMDCAASCYILNTCRVRSSAGFCTHFCLVRAKCFGETLGTQLAKAWLQRR